MSIRRRDRSNADRPALSLSGVREALGVSQSQLAERLGVLQQQVWKWERSPTLTVPTLRTIIEGLGIIKGRSAALRLVAKVGDEEFDVVLAKTLAAADPKSDDDQRAFRIRAWNDYRLERAFLDHGFVAIGDDDVELHGAHPTDTSDESIRQRLNADWPTKGRQTIGIWTAYWRTFLNEMRDGDVVVFAPKAPWVAVGEVSGPYRYEASEPFGRLRHQRPVRWLNPDVDRASLPDDLLRVVNAPGTIARIGAANAASRLSKLADR